MTNGKKEFHALPEKLYVVTAKEEFKSFWAALEPNVILTGIFLLEVRLCYKYHNTEVILTSIQVKADTDSCSNTVAYHTKTTRHMPLKFCAKNPNPHDKSYLL